MGLSWPWNWERATIDGFVGLVHLIFVAVIYSIDRTEDVKFIDTPAGKILLAMEIVTMTFHFGYAYALYRSVLDSEKFNSLKWIVSSYLSSSSVICH